MGREVLTPLFPLILNFLYNRKNNGAMKKYKYTIIFILFVNLTFYGQQTDENTFIINNYFNITNENQVYNKSSLSNANVQSNVNLEQVGYNNNIYVNSLQIGDNQFVNQAGNQNNYEYYNYYSKENSNLTINQEGTLNSLQIFGENSLSKNALINQKSNFKSIVIINYSN